MLGTSFPIAATIRYSTGLSKGCFLNGSLLYTVSEIKVAVAPDLWELLFQHHEEHYNSTCPNQQNL